MLLPDGRRKCTNCKHPAVTGKKKCRYHLDMDAKLSALRRQLPGYKPPVDIRAIVQVDAEVMDWIDKMRAKEKIPTCREKFIAGFIDWLRAQGYEPPIKARRPTVRARVPMKEDTRDWLNSIRGRVKTGEAMACLLREAYLEISKQGGGK